MSDPIVTLESVSKSYNRKIVLDGISHGFQKGESIAFAGHNGCGKSTMLKVLAGLVRIDRGRVQYSGKVRFSYVPEKFTGLDVTMGRYLYSIAGMEDVEWSKVKQLVQDFFLEDMLHIRMRQMSKGSLQKVGVVQALMAPHEILLLDEPLSGQDPESQEVFISKVNELRKQGITIFMSCHEKKLMDELSDRVYTIENGKLKSLEDRGGSGFRIFVRRNDSITSWSEMIPRGEKYMLRVTEEQMKETVMKLYGEGWELIGIDEYI